MSREKTLTTLYSGRRASAHATLFTPKLTAAQPAYELGAKAAELLVERIRHAPNIPAEENSIIRLRTEFRIREFTGPPPPDAT